MDLCGLSYRPRWGQHFRYSLRTKKNLWFLPEVLFSYHLLDLTALDQGPIGAVVSVHTSPDLGALDTASESLRRKRADLGEING